MAAVVCTPEGIDAQVSKIETSIGKIKEAPSAVKLGMLETNLMTYVEKTRDLTLAMIKDPEDMKIDRQGMVHIFGGDCIRISRMRACIEAVVLSDKWAKDRREAKGGRVDLALSAIDTVENILREKGLGKRLEEANGQCIPFVPRFGGAAPAPEPAPAPKPEPYKAPEPAPAPAPAPAPKPEPKPEPKVEASEKRIQTGAGGPRVELDRDKPRMVKVTITSELNPSFDFGPKGTMVMGLPHVTVKVTTTVDPPFPPDAKPFDEEQKFVIQIPSVDKVVFDPAAQTPAGGKVIAHASGSGKLLEFPEDIDAKFQAQTMAPWGSHCLIEGTKETHLQYECQAGCKPELAEGDDGQTELSVNLDVCFTAWLTGDKSAKFQPDGKPLPNPER
jgi:hypothetical protein